MSQKPISNFMDLLIEKGIITKTGRISPKYEALIEQYDLSEQLKLCTLLFPNDASVYQRLHAVKNNLNSPPRCKNKDCEKTVLFYAPSKTYKKYCSRSCFNSDENMKRLRRQKIEKTNTEKYGVTNPFANDNIKNKIKQTNIAKYGVHNPMLNENVICKRDKTNQMIYGGRSPLNDPTIKQKSNQTNLTKYGSITPSKSPSIREKIINSLTKDGKFPNQRHLDDNIIRQLSDKQFLTDLHHDEKKSLTQISELLKVDVTTVSNYFKIHDIEVKRYGGSLFQSKLVEILQADIDVTVNDRSIISPRELDIVVPSKKIAIEICGIYWHCELFRDKHYHLSKYNACREKGYRLLTIFEDEWVHNEKLVIDKIRNILGLSNTRKIPARKCLIQQLDSETKSKFLEQYHIQGNGPGSINYGIFYKSELVGCCSLINKNKSLILNRYATKYNVQGGFSKIVKRVEQDYSPAYIDTFADRRWSNGDLYKLNGFALIKTLPPDYRYVLGTKRVHKFNFRHAHIKHKLEHYDPNLSESANCYNHNIHRIWDCGLLKFRKVVE